MRQEIITVTEEVISELERLQLEVESRKNLIIFMIDQNMTNTEYFKIYHKEYQEYFYQYEQAKNNFQKKYVEPFLAENNLPIDGSSWQVNFLNKDCTIYIEI